MEQTLLPRRVSSNEIDSKSHMNYLTSEVYRVMNTITNKKEAQNANRKQKSEIGKQTHGPVPQTDVYLRGRGEYRRGIALPPAGRTGIQESIGSGEGHHRTCLRWVGLLERSNCRDFSSTRCRAERTANGIYDRECSNCGRASPDEEEEHLQGTQPERSNERTDPLVLPRMRQEFLSRYRNTTQLLPARSQSLTQPYHQTLSKQAPFNGGLPHYVLLAVTTPLISRGDRK